MTNTPEPSPSVFTIGSNLATNDANLANKQESNWDNTTGHALPLFELAGQLLRSRALHFLARFHDRLRIVNGERRELCRERVLANQVDPFLPTRTTNRSNQPHTTTDFQIDVQTFLIVLFDLVFANITCAAAQPLSLQTRKKSVLDLLFSVRFYPLFAPFSDLTFLLLVDLPAMSFNLQNQPLRRKRKIVKSIFHLE